VFNRPSFFFHNTTVFSKNVCFSNAMAGSVKSWLVLEVSGTSGKDP
jgi:hypothetical protein